MNLETAYRKIWSRKLRDAAPTHAQHIDRVRWTAELFCDATGPLLDVGCGSGAMLAEARSRGWQAHGVDVSADVVQWLRSQGYDVHCRNVDTEGLGTAGVGYGLVTMCDVIEHLVDPMRALRDAHDVLRPGGRLIVSTPNCAHWRRVTSLAAGKMFRTSGDPELRDGGHVAYYAPSDFGDAMLDAGFGNVAIHYRNEDECPPKVEELLVRLLGENAPADRRLWSWTYMLAVGDRS